MLNLPTFSGSMMIALILSSLLMLGIFFVIVGPALITGVDMYGRRLDDQVAWWRKLLVALVILGFAVYIAMQGVVIYKFFPYFLDEGVVAVEEVTNKAEVRSTSGAPIAFWITTQKHRFGVSEDIYENIGIGDTVSFRYRAVDDTLFEIVIVDDTTPRVSPAPSSSEVAP